MLSGFFPLSKSSPPTVALDGKYQTGWNPNQIEGTYFLLKFIR